MYRGIKKSYLFICILLLVVWLLPGCAGMTKGLDEARRVSAAYYDAIKDKDYDGALALCSEQFFEKTSKENWRDSLEKISEKLGDLQSYKLTGWNVNVQAGNGTFYTMTYKVHYSEYDSTEVLTLYRPDQKSPLLVAGQNINSDGLLK